ncbi:hypothetical protein ACFXDE_01815 [Kitasatospora sp. NPDC059408]|uniref:hypothetical protein n=1 Tax=Kitasatospora sp. NPDC059408 TaxID=3346823 RepID=UPI00368E5D56
MTGDVEAFIDWWENASDEERQQSIEDSLTLPAPSARPRIVDLPDIATYQTRRAA